ncbi:hypothetical protein FDP41_009643 [Naegleria fowleri]|uniref:Fibrous sheath-interacting protein 1 n=1 Tax=Naegleria fowleri TaxID=5763 RepID=A0A6A5B035_NAEFO|nr:uncharacterized protein FDP41_009643 [Naegleria fowleri]KAF0971947.1 hypothetical protein FDP41_009643 [Naegleria fowleri]CAG4709070.1 unnamed protein product [Naegleria fowleri]
MKKKPSSACSSSSSSLLHQQQHTKFPPIHKRASSSQASPQDSFNSSNNSTPKSSKRPTSAESSSSKHSSQSFELPIGAFLTSLPSSKLNTHRTPVTKRTVSTPESSQLGVNVSLTSLEQVPLGVSRSECPSPVSKIVHDDDSFSVCSESKVDDLKDMMMDEDFLQLKNRLAHLKTVIPNFNIDLESIHSLDDLELEDILKNKDERLIGDETQTDLSELNFSKEELESLQELEKVSQITLESEETKESQTPSEDSSQNTTDMVNIGTVSDLLAKTLDTPRMDSSIMFSESSEMVPISLNADDPRRSLELFMEELKSRKFVIQTEEGEIEENLVQLPEDLELMTKSVNSEIFEMKDDVIVHLAQANAISKEEALQEIQPGDTLESSMKKIHKLDLLLQEIENKGKTTSQLVSQIMEEHKSEREKLKKTSLMKYVRNVNKQEKPMSSTSSSFNSTALVRADSGKGLTRKRPTPRTGNKNDSFLKKNMTIREDAVFFQLSEQEEERVREIVAQDDLPEGVIPYGQGYEPSQEEIKKIANIDEKLKEIVPVERRYLFEGKAIYEEGGWKGMNKTFDSAVETAEKGDYLREARIEREHRNKIMDVEEKIAQLYEKKYEPLSREALNELIRQAKIENEMFEKRANVVTDTRDDIAMTTKASGFD